MCDTKTSNGKRTYHLIPVFFLYKRMLVGLTGKNHCSLISCVSSPMDLINISLSNSNILKITIFKVSSKCSYLLSQKNIDNPFNKNICNSK